MWNLGTPWYELVIRGTVMYSFMIVIVTFIFWNVLVNKLSYRFGQAGHH